MLLRFTNTFLLICTALLVVTGLAGLVAATAIWIYDLHRFAAWAFIALLPLKAIVSTQSLQRGLRLTFDRGLVVLLSLLLAAGTLVVVLLGLGWTLSVGPSRLAFGFSTLNLHWLLGLVLVPPFLLHLWRRWPRPKRSEFTSRRGALKVLGLGAAGLVGWQATEVIANARRSTLTPRRFTGSRESGSFQGNAFPVTTNPGSGRIVLKPDTWRLRFTGDAENPLELSYDELTSLPTTEVVATLDCTVGWYSTQVWRGVPLSDLLAHAAPADSAWLVQLESASGYSKPFLFREAADILLATHVGDEALSHQHGFPLRAVVPHRRGWFWVKWLTTIRVSSWLPSPSEV